MLTLTQALVSVLVMALVIFLCRAVPFLFFRGEGGPLRAALVSFVERAVPPVAMTVLVVASIAPSLRPHWPFGIPALVAAAATALLHLWKRNVLLSIVAGTALFMALSRGLGSIS